MGSLFSTDGNRRLQSSYLLLALRFFLLTRKEEQVVAFSCSLMFYLLATGTDESVLDRTDPSYHLITLLLEIMYRSPYHRLQVEES